MTEDVYNAQYRQQIQEGVIDLLADRIADIYEGQASDRVDADTGSTGYIPSQDDLRAIEHESWFHIRFGFRLGRRGREAFLLYVYQHDMTDKEARVLGESGCVSWDGARLRVKRSLFMALLGWVQITPLAIFTVLCIFALFVAQDPTFLSQLRIIGFMSVTAGLAFMTYKQLVYQYYLGKTIEQRHPPF